MKNNKFFRDVTKIFDADPEKLMQKRFLWGRVYDTRQEFLKTIRSEGCRGKEYSDAVVKFDKNIPRKLW